MEFVGAEDEANLNPVTHVSARLYYSRGRVVNIIGVHLEKTCSIGEMRRVLAEELNALGQDLSFFFDKKGVDDTDTVTSLGVQNNDYFMICEKQYVIEDQDENRLFFKLILQRTVHLVHVHKDTYIGDIKKDVFRSVGICKNYHTWFELNGRALRNCETSRSLGIQNDDIIVMCGTIFRERFCTCWEHIGVLT